MSDEGEPDDAALNWKLLRDRLVAQLSDPSGGAAAAEPSLRDLVKEHVASIQRKIQILDAMTSPGELDEFLLLDGSRRMKLAIRAGVPLEDVNAFAKDTLMQSYSRLGRPWYRRRPRSAD